MTKKLDKKNRRKLRKRRSKIVIGNSERPRVVLSESNRYLRAQAIDDSIHHTLVSYSTENITEKNDYSRKNKIYAQKLAEIFADKLKKEGKKSVVFDRNARPYHKKGKIEVFCETMRQLGINF